MKWGDQARELGRAQIAIVDCGFLRRRALAGVCK
jgi:hypothetical protein